MAMPTLFQSIFMQATSGICASPVVANISGWGQYSDRIPPGELSNIEKLADLIVSSFAQSACAPFREVSVVGHADKDWHGEKFEGKVSFDRAMTVQKALTNSVKSLWSARNMGPAPVGGVQWFVHGDGSHHMIAPPYHSANRRVMVTLTRNGAIILPPKVDDLVSARGTPVNPKGNKAMINIFGEREREPGFVNYTSDPQYAVGGDGVSRPWTKDPKRPPGLEDKSASDICIRSSPISQITLDEIERIAAPGARITVALNTGPDDNKPGSTDEQLQRLRDRFPNRKTLFDGVHHGTISDSGANRPTDRKVIVIEVP
jgi:hypothetical protein